MTRLKTPGGRSASTTHSASAIAGDRRRRRRRPDDGVAARKRGRDQLGRHRVGPVPRRDHADHAARPAEEQHLLAGRDRVRKAALEPLRRPRPRCASRGRAPRPRRATRAIGLPWSSVSVRASSVAPRLDRVGDAVHRGCALERGRAAPSASAARFAAAMRELRVVPVALRNLADRLARRGRFGRERLARKRGRPPRRRRTSQVATTPRGLSSSTTTRIRSRIETMPTGFAAVDAPAGAGSRRGSSLPPPALSTRRHRPSPGRASSTPRRASPRRHRSRPRAARRAR